MQIAWHDDDDDDDNTLYIIAKCNIDLVVRVFANGPGGRGSVPGRVIPKTQKSYLIPPFLTLSIISYVSKLKGNNAGKEMSLPYTSVL